MSLAGYSSLTEKIQFRFDVQENLCVFSTYISKGDNQTISKELNIVSWSGREPQVDIRGWYTKPGETIKQPGKGMSLNKKETDMLVDALVAKGYGTNIKITPPESQVIKDEKKKEEAKKSTISSNSKKESKNSNNDTSLMFNELSEKDFPF